MSLYKIDERLKPQDFAQSVDVKKECFDAMLAALSAAYDEKHTQRGRHTKLSLEDQLAMSLKYWYQNVTQKQLSIEFKVGEATVHDTIEWVKNTLAQGGEFNLPSRKASGKDTDKKVWPIAVAESKKRTFPLIVSRVHRPFDKTSEDLCLDSRTKMSRTSLASRLKSLKLFNDLFYRDPYTPSEYRFLTREYEKKDRSDQPSTPESHTLNFHWETIPLIRAYYHAVVPRKTLNKKDEQDKRGGTEAYEDPLNFLSSYKTALKEETGQYFSVFRDTDLLYRNLVMKDKLLELLPDQLTLLIITTILGSPVGNCARLKATIDALDLLIEQNLEVILGNYGSIEKLQAKLSEEQKLFNFEESIESLYMNLESERAGEETNTYIQIRGTQHDTFGIKIYPEIPGDEQLLSKIMEYITLVDKENPRNLTSSKKMNLATHDEMKSIERIAEGAYDEYRKNHLPSDIIEDAEEFNRAVKILEDLLSFKCDFESKKCEQSELFIQIQLLLDIVKTGFLFRVPPILQEIDRSETMEGRLILTPCFTLACQQISSEIEKIVFPFYSICSDPTVTEENKQLKLMEFASFLINVVIGNEPDGNAFNNCEYIEKTLYNFLKTNLNSPSAMLCLIISSSLRNIMSVLNTVAHGSFCFNEYDYANLMLIWKELFDAWVIKLTFERAAELAEKRRKIVPAKLQLLNILKPNSSAIDRQKKIQDAINEIYEQIFGTVKKPKRSDYDAT